MYAILETGGKQYRVAEGQSVKIEKLDAETGAEVTLDKVLALVKDGNAVFGAPYVANASVKVEVIGVSKDDKVIVYKQRPRKGYRKKRGHRQLLTTIKVKEIKEA